MVRCKRGPTPTPNDAKSGSKLGDWTNPERDLTVEMMHLPTSELRVR